MRWVFVLITLVLLGGSAVDLSESIVVPGVVRFAGMQLKLTRGARKRVQEKVNQLTRSKKSVHQLLERTHLFFPFIEKILADENVPDDFKFQAVHESMLIGDAVSHTEDVGFWQIQKATGLGLRLTIDDLVDERMHLIQSTKAAARFLKIQNQYFDSWLGALLAYNRGRAGAVKLFPLKCYGAKVVRLDDKTDHYIISVIAAKLAFEKMAGKKKHAKLQLFVYNQGYHGQRLEDIAAHFKIEEKLLSQHNRWLKTAVIPHHTKCPLLVPLLHTHAHIYPKLSKPLTNQSVKQKQTIVTPKKQLPQAYSIDYAKYLKPAFPEVTPLKGSPRLVKANGKTAIVAKKGDTIPYLTQLGNLRIDQFLLINEIKKTHQLIPGMLYYYSPKGSKGSRHYHVVAPGEGLWGIAQRYGMKQSALLEKNRMKQAEPLEKGRILWLRFIRPRKIPVAYYHVDPL
ncbi:MAG: transglycosylase SLT domain-containing protein [Candidatus Cardinium sp.]|uniref:LysM peptidoglycan-binding domain-containing protein n=1 Tax=Cardinium endosymbiont of Dermatophagoides farinae TaxID=2597823 RepID=UPI0011824403|nr:transglycosylase SLT domain-containing protein [Cardinium endosymbiont of Dermatophagoides farinae]TSJ80732.1 LysM peptidoglycan-binding domain-containing protein [Cardinium endosymbiont of Dermatophagoides farinae]UWW96730.1 MAG: transglycosylase SLT domain-containing protein [Candidatus Cardinium sp.]